MKSAKEPKEYNKIFRKRLFQVLIDPTRGKLFKDICERKGRKASAVLRSLAYDYAQKNCDEDLYEIARLEDKKLFDQAQQSRIDNGFNWTKK
tara:strand:- start:1791 stop:2066 length:276 start_codon:yes stop_codon:yes gene_type:complete